MRAAFFAASDRVATHVNARFGSKVDMAARRGCLVPTNNAYFALGVSFEFFERGEDMVRIIQTDAELTRRVKKAAKHQQTLD